MMEMTYKEISKYFEIINSNKGSYFYCNNRYKKPGVREDDDYYFDKMPWKNINIKKFLKNMMIPAYNIIILDRLF